jgi:hypothetical protein
VPNPWPVYSLSSDAAALHGSREAPPHTPSLQAAPRIALLFGLCRGVTGWVGRCMEVVPLGGNHAHLPNTQLDPHIHPSSHTALGPPCSQHSSWQLVQSCAGKPCAHYQEQHARMPETTQISDSGDSHSP